MTDEGTATRRGVNWAPWMLLSIPLLAIGSCVLFTWPVWFAHHVPPSVDGAVFCVTLPKIGSLFDRFEVFAISRSGSAVVVVERGNSHRVSSVVVYEYPTGQVLERIENYSEAQLAFIRAEGTALVSSPRDFDGDGVDDRTQHDNTLGQGRAVVRSGRTDEVLLESVEPLEYEDNDRLTLLGDLDGDGYSELTVIHPRSDRSEYDFEPIDQLIGARSWLSVVSGKLATTSAATR